MANGESSTDHNWLTIPATTNIQSLTVALLLPCIDFGHNEECVAVVQGLALNLLMCDADLALIICYLELLRSMNIQSHA